MIRKDRHTFGPIEAVDPKKYADLFVGSFCNISEGARLTNMDTASYREIVHPLVSEAVARYQLVPASQYANHTFPGGLLIHGYDVGARLLGEFNYRYPSPGPDATAESQERHRAMQAFALAFGLLHDLVRLRNHFQIVGFREHSNVCHTYKFKENETLWDWMSSLGIKILYVKFRRFRTIDYDLDFAFPNIVKACESAGFLERKEVREYIVNPGTPGHRLIRQKINSHDMASKYGFRAATRQLRRIPKDIYKSLVDYFGKDSDLLEDVPTGDGLFEMSGPTFIKLTEDLPQLDELFDLYELRHMGRHMYESMQE